MPEILGRVDLMLFITSFEAGIFADPCKYNNVSGVCAALGHLGHSQESTKINGFMNNSGGDSGGWSGYGTESNVSV
jgi:hypothetical protein